MDLISRANNQLDKIKSSDSVETVVGYAVFPVFPGRRVVQNGVYHLPIIVAPHHGQLPPRYLRLVFSACRVVRV